MRKLPKPIPRLSAKKLAALKGKPVYSTISSPKKAIRKSNPERQAKRKAGYRKLLVSPEYKAAKREAMERARGQCEEMRMPTLSWSPEKGLHETLMRCFAKERLQAHHLRYPKSRPIAASDLKILCRFHHEQVEGQKMHKQRMF